MTIDRFATEDLHVLLFTSPKAGTGAGREQIPALIERLKSQRLEGQRVQVSLVHCVAELQRHAESRSQPENVVVVAAGGDGTLALAAATVDRQVPIVPMPLGTENLLARHFGHRADASAVARTIRYGGLHALDVGQANGKPFLIMATCGFDAEVVRTMHLTRRGHIRRWSYLWPIARALRRYRFPDLRVRVDDGEELSAGWAMVFNLPCYAVGLSIEPEAKEDDGQLDVITFAGRSVVEGLKHLAEIRRGRHLSSPGVVRRRGRTIRIEVADRSRVAYQLDGDYAGRLPLEIQTMPARVQLLLPPANTGG